MQESVTHYYFHHDLEKNKPRMRTKSIIEVMQFISRTERRQKCWMLKMKFKAKQKRKLEEAKK